MNKLLKVAVITAASFIFTVFVNHEPAQAADTYYHVGTIHSL